MTNLVTQLDNVLIHIVSLKAKYKNFTIDQWHSMLKPNLTYKNHNNQKVQPKTCTNKDVSSP